MKKYIFLMLFIIIGSFLFTYGPTYAKYVSNFFWDYYFHSKGFYFYSDHLSFEETKKVNSIWNGESIPFNLKNNLNQTVITNYDIEYRIVCTVTGEVSSYAECHLNGSESNIEDGILPAHHVCYNSTGDGIDVSSFDEEECKLKDYEWRTQIVIQDLYFDVVLIDDEYELTEVVVNVTVTSTNPYQKTLSGNFHLYKNNITEDDLIMKYDNYTNYDRLIISNSYSETKCVEVSWDASKLIIDADYSQFSSYSTDSNGYINKIKFNIGPKNSLSYIFYKKDFDITYDVSEFTINQSDGC